MRARDLLRRCDWGDLRVEPEGWGGVAIRDRRNACPILHVLQPATRPAGRALNNDAVWLACAAGMSEVEARALMLAADCTESTLMADCSTAWAARQIAERRRALRYRRWMMAQLARAGRAKKS